MSLVARLPALLPAGWTLTEDPFLAGTFHAAAPETDAFRDTFTVAPAVRPGESIEALHEHALETAWMQMTDAVLLDHGPEPVGGAEAFSSTAAFRQGPFTLTVRYWTIACPGDAGRVVVVGAVCDAERYAELGARFEHLAGALELRLPAEIELGLPAEA